MARFRYVARNAAGGTTRGTLAADSVEAATEELRKRGLLPLAVAPEGSGRAAGPVAVECSEPAGPASSIGGAVSAYAAQRVSAALGRDTQDHAWKLLVTRSTLLDMLRYSPDELPDWVGPTVASAEEHGVVDAALPEIERAIHEDDRQKRVYDHYTLFWQTTAALTPLILGVVVHATSKVNASAAELVRRYGPIVVLCNLLFFGLRMAWRCRRGRAWRERVRLRLPVLGPALQAFSLQRLGRFLAAYVAHGLDIRTALGAAAHATGIARTTSALVRAAANTPADRPLRDLFAASQLFPESVLSQVGVYEQGGRTSEIAAWLSRELDRRGRDAQHAADAFGAGTALLIGLFVIGALALIGTRIGNSQWLHNMYLLNDKG